MSMLRRFQKLMRPPLRRLGAGDEDAHFRLRLPARNAQSGDWLSFDCVLTAREDADGEHLRLRTHLHADFSRALPKPTPEAQNDTARLIEGPPGKQRQRALARLGAHAGGLLDRALRTAPMRRALAPISDQRVESWMDIRGTTAPHDIDSRDMLPEGLARVGVMPAADGPPIQSWEAPTEHGMAQITTMHLDERDLHRGKRGPRKPLRLAATLAQIVETVPHVKSD